MPSTNEPLSTSRSAPGPGGTGAPFDLVLAGTGLGVHALARAFHEEYGVVATVVTKVGIEPMRRSVTCDLIELGSDAGDEDMISALVSLAQEREAAPGGARPQLLLANADSVIQLLSDHREALEPHFVLPILDADTLERLTDKAEFARLCTEHGVATPRTEVVDFARVADLANTARSADTEGDAAGPGDDDPSSVWQPPSTTIPFPLVVKAARTADMAHVDFEGKKKVWFVESAEELDDLLRRIAGSGYAGRVVVQELIPGDDTTEGSITAYTDAAGRVTLLCSARVLLGEHTPDALEEARTLLEATGYRGFANLDVKLDPRDGTWKFFEVNPRIGRNNFYVTAAGQNVARFVVADAIEHRELEPVIQGSGSGHDGIDEILYSLVPQPLLMRYVRDPAQKRWVRTVARRGIKNPWVYGPDGAWMRRYARMVQLNHVRKFLRYYPKPTDSGF
jgi:D-aspartate ligase